MAIKWRLHKGLVKKKKKETYVIGLCVWLRESGETYGSILDANIFLKEREMKCREGEGKIKMGLDFFGAVGCW